MLVKILLVCGILSSVLYIGSDILAATMLYPGYSYTSQQVSELSAIGAPTRTFWIAMSYVFIPLVVAFAIGVWLFAGRSLSLRVTSALLFAFAVVAFIWMFFPMHQPGTGTVASDAMHLIVGVTQVLLMVLFISFGAVALGWGFRFYSIVTIVALLGFGAIVSTQAPAIAAGHPMPWLGIIERVSVYLPVLWVLIFAVMLLRTQGMSESLSSARGL